jgi:hypothetical protein
MVSQVVFSDIDRNGSPAWVFHRSDRPQSIVSRHFVTCLRYTPQSSLKSGKETVKMGLRLQNLDGNHIKHAIEFLVEPQFKLVCYDGQWQCMEGFNVALSVKDWQLLQLGNEVTFHVTFKQKTWTLTLPSTITVIDLKNKLATTEYAGVPARSQRLVYLARFLRDNDSLVHEVKIGDTIRLVQIRRRNRKAPPQPKHSEP